MSRILRHRLEYIALSVLKWVANALPEGVSRSVGAVLGGIVGYVWQSRRAIAIGNIRRVRSRRRFEKSTAPKNRNSTAGASSNQ